MGNTNIRSKGINFQSCNIGYLRYEQKRDLVFGDVSSPSSEATFQLGPNPSPSGTGFYCSLLRSCSFPGVLPSLQSLLFFYAVLAVGQVITLLESSIRNWLVRYVKSQGGGKKQMPLGFRKPGQQKAHCVWKFLPTESRFRAHSPSPHAQIQKPFWGVQEQDGFFFPDAFQKQDWREWKNGKWWHLVEIQAL